jgi:hypothetical protein
MWGKQESRQTLVAALQRQTRCTRPSANGDLRPQSNAAVQGWTVALRNGERAAFTDMCGNDRISRRVSLSAIAGVVPELAIQHCGDVVVTFRL